MYGAPMVEYWKTTSVPELRDGLATLGSVRDGSLPSGSNTSKKRTAGSVTFTLLDFQYADDVAVAAK